jgi:hypothetical protein
VKPGAAPGAAAQRGRPAHPAAPGQGPDQFQELRASALYCPKCREATPTREVLLLVLPDGGSLLDYRCARCGTSTGSRTAKPASNVRVFR